MAHATLGWFTYDGGQGNASKFLKHSKRAITIDSSSFWVRFTHAFALLFAGYDSEAAAAYKEVMADEPARDDIASATKDLSTAQKKWLSPERAKPIWKALGQLPKT
jgi:hypothetical protein